jgi:hypothetical protein
MAKSFPSDFYVTCATVIPVLFLARAVQAERSFPSYLRAFIGLGSRSSTRHIPDGRGISAAQGFAMRWPGAVEAMERAAYVFLAYVGLANVIAGGIGEALALQALYSRSDYPVTRVVVLVTTLLLVVSVLTGPLLASIAALEATRRGAASPSPQAADGKHEAAGDQHSEQPGGSGGEGDGPGAG